ncbi:MAG TPA: MFS transporter [Vicinamibacterales bacterium]|nr:MFS transporter [Vicinamibacterales bacterium]
MNPYIRILRENRNFRLLYIGQTISQLGDWFNAVAVYALLLDLTGSATAVAWMMITQLLPIAIVGPIAGVVVDRVDRRRLMIAADVLRGCLILGLLLVRRADQVWIAYAATALTVAAQGFFEPARTATIPSITSPQDLLPANALSSATWSVMLAVGASAGGAVTALFGRNVAFVINAASFFWSALFILQTKYDSRPSPREQPAGLAAMTGVADLVDGIRYIRRERHVAALMCVKAGWGLAGGVLLLLAVFGQRVFPIAGGAAAGIGVLYGARGIGTGIGPIALRWMLGQQPRTLRRTIGPAFFTVGIFYAALAAAPTLALAAIAVALAHLGGSILWVFSTVLLQLEVPDRFRGRVFAAELALATLINSISAYWTAYELDRIGRSPRLLAFVLGALFCIPGALWLLIESRWIERPPVGGGPADPATAAEEEVLEGRIG